MAAGSASAGVLRERLRRLLVAICAGPQTESRWLNTLSLLEYIGARKIAKTVAQVHPSLTVLDHLADETRHALCFKRLAHRVWTPGPEGYIAGDAAKRYFYELDQGVAELVQTEFGTAGDSAVDPGGTLNYLLVTTVVERRAMMLYPLYRSVTPHSVVREELARVIAEEQEHRRALEAECVRRLAAVDRTLAPFEVLELRLLGPLLAEIEADVLPGECSAADEPGARRG